MADHTYTQNRRPPSLPVTAASPAVGSLPDIVGRAAAILVRETPVAALPFRTSHAAAGAGRTPPVAAAATDDLRQRALDLVSALFSAVGIDSPARKATAAEATVPWRRAPTPTAAGSLASISFYVENQDNRPAQVSFYCTDLLSDNGNSVPSYQVSFDPQNRTIGPSERALVKVNVAVPPQSIPGSYSGLIQAVGLCAAKAVITIEIL
jgi:hypothetical protein